MNLDYEMMADALDEAWGGLYSATEALEGSGTRAEEEFLDRIRDINRQIFLELEECRVAIQHRNAEDERQFYEAFVRKEIDG